MKDYKQLKKEDILKFIEKTKRIEQAYDKYKNNKTDENKNNWFNEIRGE